MFDNYKTPLTMFAVDCHASSYFSSLLLNLVLLEEKEESFLEPLLFPFSIFLGFGFGWFWLKVKTIASSYWLTMSTPINQQNKTKPKIRLLFSHNWKLSDMTFAFNNKNYLLCVKSKILLISLFVKIIGESSSRGLRKDFFSFTF